MSFFGFDTTLPRDRGHPSAAPGFSQAQDPFANLSGGPGDDDDDGFVTAQASENNVTEFLAALTLKIPMTVLVTSLTRRMMTLTTTRLEEGLMKRKSQLGRISISSAGLHRWRMQ